MNKTLLKAGGAAMLLALGLQTNAQTRILLDTANMDKSVKPGDNFYRYANGRWLDKNPVPPSETRWGSFNELQENNYKALHELLEEAAASKAPANTAEGKIGNFYRSGMDSTRIEKEGLTPLQADFARIGKIKNTKELMQEFAYLHTQGLGQGFSFYVGPDDKEVTRMAAQFYQGGLGIPDRDYYFKDDQRSKTIRQAYVDYMVQAFMLMGESKDNAHRLAGEVMKLETSLAEASMTRVEMRDPYKLYNKMEVARLDQQEKEIGWASLMNTLGAAKESTVIVGQPAFFERFNKELTATPITTWQAYLKFHLFNDVAPYLYSKADEMRFAFYGKTLRGQQAQRDRWKRVLQVIDGSIGELLGQVYVARNFKPEAKERMVALVSNLQQTYADRIQRLDWMSEATKTRALAKLNTFMKKIGYPDKWRDYSKLTIVPNNYLANAKAASAFDFNYMVSKLGKPVDRSEWGMTPPTVNAYYNPAFNEIVFPAGILQYPFFEFTADDAVNYGGIGAVIGHEMTHGFDDQGRQYDATGNLKDWWTEADAKQFTDKANVVVNQFNNYTVLDTVHVNGELTLGENLADLGGLAIAYEAFEKTKQAKEGKLIDGFTPEQRFFLSWAQVWRANTRPEEIAQRIVTDPHSPNELRANGPLSNMPEFYKAFDVKPGDKMYREPKDRAKVW